MDLSNCLRCKKVFPKFSDPICEECKKEEEKMFEDAKEYLNENPKVTVGELSEATGASAKKIMAWLREGRLEIASGRGELKCMQCAADIGKGRYCENCATEINKTVSQMIAKSNSKSAGPTKSSGSVTMHTRRSK